MVTEGGRWAEEIVSDCEDDSSPLFLGGLHPRDGEVSGACAVAKFTEHDWGRAKDMVFSIKGGSCGDRSLTQASTPEESAGSDRPDGGMERIREIDAVVQSCEVFNRHWGTQGALVSRAFLVGRGAGEMNPVVVTVPRGVVDQVPAAYAGQPSHDGAASLVAFVFSNKGTEERVGGWHASLLVDFPTVAELCETEEASGVCSLGVGSESITDRCGSGFYEWHWEGLSQ